MINNKVSCFFSVLLLLPTISSHAQSTYSYKYPFYVGFSGGPGSTTWDGLVPRRADQNININLSTPIHTQEGGWVWGALAGYEISPFFAVEANYMHYPSANVMFDPEFSMFSVVHNGMISFSTHTESVSLLAKIMLVVPHSNIRVYSSGGMANVHRKDMIINDWHLGASFGMGMNYHFTEHLMGEFGGNYTTGYGESRITPADTYFPFLYSLTMRMAYCF